MGKWGKVDYRELKKQNDRIEQLLEVDWDQLCRDMAQEIAKVLWNKVKKRTPAGVKPHIAQRDENDIRALGGPNAKKTARVKGASGKSQSFLTREGAIYQKYWAGYKGGDLRDAWVVSDVSKHGDTYGITVLNPLEYASYVEYGHRQTPGRYVGAIGKRLKASWVKGRFMLTISEQEVKDSTPKILNDILYKALKDTFDA